MGKSINELYEDLRSGNPLSDEELKRLYYHVKHTTDSLQELGDMFHVTFAYLLNDQYAMETFLRNRGVEF